MVRREMEAFLCTTQLNFAINVSCTYCKTFCTGCGGILSAKYPLLESCPGISVVLTSFRDANIHRPRHKRTASARVARSVVLASSTPQTAALTSRCLHVVCLQIATTSGSYFTEAASPQAAKVQLHLTAMAMTSLDAIT